MRQVPFIMALTLLAYGSIAQDSTAYKKMLDPSAELVYTDSLHFSRLNTDTLPLDSSTVKRYFSALLSQGPNRFKNKTYSLLGKITSNKNYDLLVILEDKRRADSSGICVIYLVSMKKWGDYISNMKVVVNGTKKKSGSGYNINSALYNENKIIQDAKITTHDQLYDDVTYYRIIAGGRFILDAKD